MGGVWCGVPTTGFPLRLVKTAKTGEHFPVREKSRNLEHDKDSGNFTQNTGKWGKYWKVREFCQTMWEPCWLKLLNSELLLNRSSVVMISDHDFKLKPDCDYYCLGLVLNYNVSLKAFGGTIFSGALVWNMSILSHSLTSTAHLAKVGKFLARDSNFKMSKWESWTDRALNKYLQVRRQSLLRPFLSFEIAHVWTCGSGSR